MNPLSMIRAEKLNYLPEKIDFDSIDDFLKKFLRYGHERLSDRASEYDIDDLTVMKLGL